jgi:hypothetical protein
VNKIKLILGVSFLLLVSGQVGASFLYGIGRGGSSGDHIKSIDIDTGVSTRLFSVPLFQTSGLAIPPNPIPIPAAIWLFGTALIGLVGFSRKSKSA